MDRGLFWFLPKTFSPSFGKLTHLPNAAAAFRQASKCQSLRTWPVRVGHFVNIPALIPLIGLFSKARGSPKVIVDFSASTRAAPKLSPLPRPTGFTTWLETKTLPALARYANERSNEYRHTTSTRKVEEGE